MHANQSPRKRGASKITRRRKKSKSPEVASTPSPTKGRKGRARRKKKSPEVSGIYYPSPTNLRKVLVAKLKRFDDDLVNWVFWDDQTNLFKRDEFVDACAPVISQYQDAVREDTQDDEQPLDVNLEEASILAVDITKRLRCYLLKKILSMV